MTKNEFIKKSIIYETLKKDIHSYQKKHKFLSNVLSNFLSLCVVLSIAIFAFFGKIGFIVAILLMYLLFVITKDILLTSYLKKSFHVVIDNEKKHGFLTKSVKEFKDIFEENELKFIHIQISMVKDYKKFSWKQANDYLKILKLINSK